jgi:hypothetical protein
MPGIEPLAQDGKRARHEPSPEIGVDASNVDNSIDGDVAPRGFEQRKGQIAPARYPLLPLPLRVLALRFGVTTTVLCSHGLGLPERFSWKKHCGLPCKEQSAPDGSAAAQDVDDPLPGVVLAWCGAPGGVVGATLVFGFESNVSESESNVWGFESNIPGSESKTGK